MPVRHSFTFGLGLVLLAILATLVVWQGSFDFGGFGPATTGETYFLWSLSTLIFLLTIAVAFYLFRHAVKLYIERRRNQEGSHIRTKIVVGAMALCFMPTVFLVLWSVEVLNRNLHMWFSRPAMDIRMNLIEVGEVLQQTSRTSAQQLADLITESEGFRTFMRTGERPAQLFTSLCSKYDAVEIFVRRSDGGQMMICQQTTPRPQAGREVEAKTALAGGGDLLVRTRMPIDVDRTERAIATEVQNYDQIKTSRDGTRRTYLQLLALITLFVLLIALWVAMFLARQITTPITALLEAAREVRRGNLTHRVRVDAIDEFATLVRSFNEMTSDLATHRDELERRRRFIEAVLEAIPTGVVSLAGDGAIQLTNNALKQIYSAERLKQSHQLSDLLRAEEQAEVARLLKRARRTGVANRQMEIQTASGPKHLSVTVSALDEKSTSGFVLVLEDTSELLRAQKAAAWHEVARRIAHELKNPLTPITLSAERILRQIDRSGAPPEVKRIVEECGRTIIREAESVKTLADEFSQFARFPSAQPAPGDLNAAVREGLAVFEGRLSGIGIDLALAANLPPVALDREQFKRVIVNLVDNAAEAMQESAFKQISITTQAPAPETVELIVADTGCGISTEDKEKLFLPYFSTKQRGTGLGLAIVSHILAEHGAHIRVEENHPAGARFIIEMPAVLSAEPAPAPLEMRS